MPGRQSDGETRESFGVDDDLEALKRRAATSKNVRINSELERLKNKLRSKK